VEQDQGLRAIAGKGVADCSAVDFDEGSFVSLKSASVLHGSEVSLLVNLLTSLFPEF
jgi:hypothetical protein